MFTGLMVKKGTKMSFSNKKDALLYQMFIDSLKDGEIIEMLVTVKGKKANNAQISKVHACIRMLASELGYSFDEMKIIIKDKSGLWTTDQDEVIYKSFADCSSDEISSAIETCNELGREMNIIL
jgi:hypothetical protein